MLTRLQLPNLDPMLVRAQDALHHLQSSFQYVTGLRVVCCEMCFGFTTPKLWFRSRMDHIPQRGMKASFRDTLCYTSIVSPIA